MKKEYFGQFCFECCILISLVVCVSKCPSSSQWQFQAKSRCLKTHGYICLFDENRKTFTEICKNESYSERAGYKNVLAGNLDQRKCENTRYQPFQFSTYGLSTCVFEKTYCSEEGQIVFNNGSTKSDRQCRCDYTRGYDFISKPKHGCFCIPSMDDCSCYQKPCPKEFILSPDYQCINLSNWDAQFTCELIVPYKSKNTNFPIDEEYTDDSITGPVMNMKIVIAILIGVSLTISVIMALMTNFCLPKIEYLTEQNTELKFLLTATVIPQHIRDAQTHLKQLWMKRFGDFVETTASKKLEEIIQKEQCITVYGPMGCGKSSTAFHIAMALQETMDFNFMIISNPDDLLRYATEDQKQIFLLDDFFGKYSVNDFNTMWWNQYGEFIQNILKRNTNLKLIITSKLHIFHSFKLEQPKFCHLNFISEDLTLTLRERQNIGRCYLRDGIIDKLSKEVILSYCFFPALCANVRDESIEHVVNYFELPVKYLRTEVDNMRKSGDLFYVALATLIIFDNKVKKDNLNDSNNKFVDTLQFLSKEVGFVSQPLKSKLFSRFIALKESYVVENNNYFQCLHTNLFNVLVHCIGPCILRSIILHGEWSFLNKRTNFETSDGYHSYNQVDTIVIPKELQAMYFNRMMSDMTLGKHDFFESHQYCSFELREACITYLKSFLTGGDLKEGSDATTVLHVVSEKGFDDYVELFLGLAKSLVNRQDNIGQTALHKACKHGHTNVAKILLDNGALIDITDKSNQTAIYIASEKGQIDTVKFMLSCGANIKPNQTDLRSPLHIMCFNGNEDIAELMLKKKADVNYQDTKFKSPLHLACKKGHANVVKLLVQYKADVNVVDYKNRTALYIAADQGDTAIVRCLLQSKPLLDIPTNLGRVALHCASKDGSREIAALLIENKANTNIDDLKGCTPLYVACENGHLQIVELLLLNNAKVQKCNALRNTPLLIACENDNTKIVRLLLERKADANFENSDQMTPLHKACASDQTDIVFLLINYGASVNKPDKDLQTPLIIACSKGNYKVADALLKVGALVNYANRTGLTPLHEACMRERNEIVQLLLDYDADIQKEATNGLTPLAMACKSGNKCIEDALLMKLHDKQKTHQVSK